MDLQQNRAAWNRKRGCWRKRAVSTVGHQRVYDLLQKPRQEIIDLCLAEVRHALPAARKAVPTKATVIRKPRPHFRRNLAWTAGVQCKRPRFCGMFLAGDWTATGWPATMEGAVRSGYLAAEAVLRVAGKPRKFLQPDLPPDGW